MSVRLDIPPAEMAKMRRQLNAWQAKKRDQMTNLINETADLIVKDARSAVPVDEGNLKASIRRWLAELAGSHPEGQVTAGGPGARHAHLVEFGTVKMRAQPFLNPAFERHAPEFLRKLRSIANSE